MATPVKSGPSSVEGIFGRRAELDALLSLFNPDGPELVTLTGVPGIGKSSLLRWFARSGCDRGTGVHVLDCRTVEPAVRCFDRALEDGGFEIGNGRTSVLCLDHYDHFLLLDAWLRTWFVRERGNGLRLVLASRRSSGLGWSMTGARALAIRLETLDEKSTTELLLDAGVDAQSANQIWRFTKGHPLALRLALAARHAFSPHDFHALALPEVVHRLTGYFLEDVEEPRTREALEAASTVRRVTRPILDEMLARTTATALYETLASLPLMEVRSDGLSLHPTVHEAVSRWLRSADPARFTTYRRRAWLALERDRSNVAAPDLWRYTADVIYLIEDPIVREAFFPSSSSGYSVDPARPEDHGVILAITELHDGSGERELVARWLDALPEAFHVIRDAQGVVQGFYCLFDAAAAPASALAGDPISSAWHADLPNFCAASLGMYSSSGAGCRASTATSLPQCKLPAGSTSNARTSRTVRSFGACISPFTISPLSRPPP